MSVKGLVLLPAIFSENTAPNSFIYHPGRNSYFHRSDWSDSITSGSEVTQSCLTLCNPMDCSLQGSTVHGISYARILEWVAISFSRKSSQPRDWTQVSQVTGSHFTIRGTREAIIPSLSASKRLSDSHSVAKEVWLLGEHMHTKLLPSNIQIHATFFYMIYLNKDNIIFSYF